MAKEVFIIDNEMYIGKYFTLYEIELLTRMCATSLSSNDFTEKEKEDIKSILENTLV